MADVEEQQPLLSSSRAAEEEDDDDGAFATAAEDEQQRQRQQQQRSDEASSRPSRPPPLAPPPPPSRPPPLTAGLAAALPAALSHTAVADLLAHLPEQLQRVAGTTEGVVLLFVSALVFALAVAALLRALLGASPSSRRRRGAAPRQGPLVVLAGPSNGGKTAIFLRLRDGAASASSTAPPPPLPATVASMAANSAPARVRAAPGRAAARTVTVLDVPGHASHRPRLEQALAEASGVVFVVDSADVSPHRTDAADCLYDVLAGAGFAKRRLPLLVACNKSDLELDAHSADFVRKTLERQLDAMRKTRTAGIGRTAAAAASDGGGGMLLLGVPADQPFSFAAMAPRHRVTLAEVSALQGKLAEVEAFAAGV
jgi:signal recognition particle receptor subunit beta